MDGIPIQKSEANDLRTENLYLSTIAEDASITARQHGFGIEIAEYCTAWNMDDEFSTTDAEVQKKLHDIQRCVLHAPFNELFPCAIDRKARALASERYRQALDLAKRYNATKVIVHGGYNPWIYYPIWYIEQSIVFWTEFLQDIPANTEIALENVLETDPHWLLDILKGVGHPLLHMCFDIGHANAYSDMTTMDWLELCAPYIGHFHIHNNDGQSDQHNILANGSLPMKEFLLRASELCPDATFTLEVMEAEKSVYWLKKNGII